MSKKIQLRGDDRMNPRLREEIQTLRGGFVTCAEQQPLPSRFTTEQDPSRPAMIITDSITGRQTTVAFFAYREVRAVLTELFADL